MTVLQKQCLLVYLDCMNPGEIDGIWGPKSAKATEAMQRKLGIEPDGVWGDQTERAVRKYFSLETEEAKESGTFWDHIRYWTREEFRCRCGEYHAPYCDGFPVEPDQTLVELVDDLRHRAGAPGHRSSGIRCPRHNKDSAGVDNSKHLTGKALDFFIEGVSGEKLLQLALEDPRTSYAYQIEGQYVHVDVI